ncbi:MAG: hypothetical protein CL666_08695 [Balneola sp.]|nr:hypothetical protein [Balneola sp.]|tara:strand:+ start:14713 stop:15165 length:453 start_codon:yes stop_codon:yes gene_type:complete
MKYELPEEIKAGSSLKEKCEYSLLPNEKSALSDSAKKNFTELVRGLDSQLKPVTPFDDSKSNYDEGYDRIFKNKIDMDKIKKQQIMSCQEEPEVWSRVDPVDTNTEKIYKELERFQQEDILHNGRRISFVSMDNIKAIFEELGYKKLAEF